MSLLNDVLRDLQTRGAYDVEPLTGLEPVSDPRTHHGRRAYMLSALAALPVVAAVLLWQPAIVQQWLPSISGLTAETRPYSQTPDPDPVDVQLRPEPTVTPVADTPVADTSVADTPRVSEAAVVEEASAVAQAATVEDTVSVTDTPAHVEIETTPPPSTTTVLRRDALDASAQATTAVARGLTAMRGSDFSTAERLFREALVIDPGDGAVWGYLYSIQVRTARTAAAEQTLRQGLIAAERPAPLAKLYARMLLDRGEKNAAVRALQTHRPASGSDTEYDAFLAALLQQLGRYADAAQIYRALLGVDESSGSWWIGLGISQDSLGNHLDALSAFERAQRTSTLNPTLAKYAHRRISELQPHE
jgi:MSHA biogenesis protein MshN